MENKGYINDDFDTAEGNPKNAAVKVSSEGTFPPRSQSRRAILAQVSSASMT